MNHEERAKAWAERVVEYSGVESGLAMEMFFDMHNPDEKFTFTDWREALCERAARENPTVYSICPNDECGMGVITEDVCWDCKTPTRRFTGSEDDISELAWHFEGWDDVTELFLDSWYMETLINPGFDVFIKRGGVL
jgi:hypothetical protein